ncbi:TPA: hypothetical protein GXZ34_00935 [bacterium]|nr:hypothetical protein [bacterium]
MSNIRNIEDINQAIKEIEDLIKEGSDNHLLDKYTMSAVAGALIRLNSICEHQFYSPVVEKAINKIYYLRQDVIHHQYFEGLGKVNSKFNEIRDDFESVYEIENSFFNKLLNYNYLDTKNLVLKSSNRVKFENDKYYFYDKENNAALIIPRNKVYKVTKDGRDFEYIIKDETAILSNGVTTSKVDNIAPFFKENNYVIKAKDTTKHYKVFKDVLKKYCDDPYLHASISSDSGTITTTDFLDNFLYNRTVDQDFIVRQNYRSNYRRIKVSSINRNSLYNPREINKLRECYTTNEYFLINLLIKSKKKVDEEYKKIVASGASEAFIKNYLVNSLSSLYEIGVENLNKDFVVSNKSRESDKLFKNIRNIRNFYSHNDFDNPNNTNISINTYYEQFTNLTNYLEVVKNTLTPKLAEEKILTCKYISTSKEHLINSKHRHFIESSPRMYLGSENAKFYYSMEDYEKNTFGAIMPYSRDMKIHIYERQDNNDMKIISNIDDDAKRRANAYIDNFKTVYLDVNSAALLNAFYSYDSGKGDCPYIVFNNNKGEKLSTTIFRILNKKYVHQDLIGVLSLDYVNGNYLISKDEEVIANIVNKGEFDKRKVEELDLNLFSRDNTVGEAYNRKVRI